MPARHIRRTALALVSALFAPVAALAQGADSSARAGGFFASETPIEITLTANFGALRGDTSEDPDWRRGSIRYRDSAGATAELPIRIRPRGVWRRRNCEMPPLRLDLPRGRTAGTPFAGLDRPKLVSYCVNTERGDEYVLQELQLYRIYQLLTPASHRVRLLRIAYADSGTGRVRAVHHAFLVEEPREMAQRLGGRLLELHGMESEWLEPRSRTLFGVFQHLIGNHDWSFRTLHNIEVIGRDSVMIPIAYDFDNAGAIDAHYARPSPQLPIRQVRERYYRGECAPPELLADVLQLFRSRRAAIRALYEDEIGRLMRPDVIRRTIAYFDAFHAEIDDPRAVQQSIVARCGPA